MQPEHGSESHPITLFDDDEENIPPQYAEVQNIIRRARELALGGRPLILIDEDEPVDAEYERQLSVYEADYDNEVQVQQQALRRRGQPRSIRNPQLNGTHRPTSTVTVKGRELKIDSFVELYESLDICLMMGEENSPPSPVNTQFVEIKSIWVSRNLNHDIIVRGLPYTRNRNLCGRLESKKNEICQILEVDNDDERPDEEQALVEVRPEQIMKTRTLVTTNRLWLREVDSRFDPAYNTSEKVEHLAPLTCRWKMRLQYMDAPRRKAGKAYGGSIIKLSEDDVVKRRNRVSDRELREAWRGPSGSTTARSSSPYIFGDMFCGAGGVSRGAVMAGLEVKIAVDHWPLECKSYRRNFPNARLYEQEITEFITNKDIDYKSHPIDILHMSPPCQYFSPLAYVWGGRKNEANADALFSCFNVIDKLRPRACMLEETAGLTHARHALYFNALIHGFTCHGYSVHWLVACYLVFCRSSAPKLTFANLSREVVCFRDFGSPSRRSRLAITGACPGDKLPPILPPTHGAVPAPGRKPWVTEIQAIGHLRPGTDLHDVRNARAVNVPPRDGNIPLPETICCGGTQKHYHFSGKRQYTLRELACLQGFPVVHRFEGNLTGIRKQIGNAFPPCVAGVFLEHIRRQLERTDGVQPVRRMVQLHPSRGLHSADSSSHRRQRDGWETDLEAQRDVKPRIDNYNGDFDEDEALQFALQESKNVMNGASRPAAPGTHRKVQQGFVDLRDSSDDDEVQDSPVGRHFAPLMECMSIASSRTSSHTRHSSLIAQASQASLDLNSDSDSDSRSRSATLDFGPEPSRKRSLDDMHDGVEDTIVKKESPEKRERLAEETNGNNIVPDDYVDLDEIPSSLPKYNGSWNSSDAVNDAYVVLGRPSGSAAAAATTTPKREGDHSEDLVWGDKTSYNGAVEKKQRPPTSSRDRNGWNLYM
ncbi:Modification methylase HphIA [Cytospora mali]|uniref:DNA (cytosine-5-)-methyltransferase n=1 Tax=Cytospora mali TaxID=578113 RepID=A0A194US11_CYTMA|nr:Modification methylase HphIA [Valsa mali var. pyri (nom. inval.)]